MHAIGSTYDELIAQHSYKKKTSFFLSMSLIDFTPPTMCPLSLGDEGFRYELFQRASMPAPPTCLSWQMFALEHPGRL